MSKKIIFLFFTFINSVTFSQRWTPSQLAEANTAKDVKELSQIEKETILYINLARLFPKEFVKNEVAGYNGSAKYRGNLEKSQYRASLVVKLNSMKSLTALVFDKTLYENAKCFAEEQGKSGDRGHNRKKCEKGNYAECCSYGMDTGKDVAMQWLVDENITSVGHRKICLDAKYTKIGISEHSHKQWDTCSIAEFIY